MGNSPKEKEGQRIAVATLNYSGIVISPFEFFRKDPDSKQPSIKKIDDPKQTNKPQSKIDQIEAINKNMMGFLVEQGYLPEQQQTQKRSKNAQKEQQKSATKLNQQQKKQADDSKVYIMDVGNLDRIWQKVRYSPMYNELCGCRHKKYLENKDLFEESWDICMKKKKAALSKKKEKEGLNKEETDFLDKLKSNSSVHLKNLRLLDFLVYKSILYHVYSQKGEKDTLDQMFAKEIKKEQRAAQTYSMSAEKYLDFMLQTFNNASYIDEDKKIKKTFQTFSRQNLDFIFLQQATRYLVERIYSSQIISRKYRVVHNNELSESDNNIILINSKRFPDNKSLPKKNEQIYQLLKNNERLKKLNKRYIVQVVADFVLICVHLTSKTKQMIDREQQAKNQTQEKVKQVKKVIKVTKIQKGKKKMTNQQLIKLLLQKVNKTKKKDLEKLSNKQQVLLLGQTARKIMEIFPLYHLIIAGCFNTDKIQPLKFELNKDLNQNQSMFQQYPKKKTQRTNQKSNQKKELKTNFKKRTYLQSQLTKAMQPNKSCVDYIFTNITPSQKEINNPADDWPKITRPWYELDSQPDEKHKRASSEKSSDSSSDSSSESEYEIDNMSAPDRILSQRKTKDLKNVEWSICFIDGQPAQGSDLLPNNTHPYDHYMVKALFDLPEQENMQIFQDQKKESSKSKDRRIAQEKEQKASCWRRMLA